jgi:hypothetical protein
MHAVQIKVLIGIDEQHMFIADAISNYILRLHRLNCPSMPPGASSHSEQVQAFALYNLVVQDWQVGTDENSRTSFHATSQLGADSER